MQQFEQNFLETLTRDFFGLSTPVRKLIFQLRFDPKFHPENGIEERQNKQLAKIVKERLNEDVSDRIGTELKCIVRTLASTFETQMINDGVDVELLRSEERGKKGKWLVLYDWLWQKYFPRWLLEQLWQKLVDKADKVDDWLHVEEIKDRDLRVPEPRKSTIPLERDVYLLVNLKLANRYLLLLNQGTKGNKYCLCPSKGFAPSCELSDEKMYLPQIGAMAPSISFEEVGKEHFLGIMMDKPLNLEWLRPNEGDPAPSLDAIRLKQLWEQLEQQGNWQMFYKSFDVV